MISFRHEQTFERSGYELTAVVRIKLTQHSHGSGWLITGSKELVALICRADNGENILDPMGNALGRSELDMRMSVQQSIE